MRCITELACQNSLWDLVFLRTLRLLSFRAHRETDVGLAPKLNLIYGPNGAGKTNLLEAVHYLCLTKSFLASQDRYALRQGCPYFEIEGQFEGERRAELRVRLVYVPEEGKRLFVNGAPLERLSDVVGMLPVVVLSPEDHVLTAGGPEERRRFLNNILSQSRPVYLDDVLKYRRALRQRNELLMQHRRRRNVSPSLMASWDAELVMLGSRVVARRHAFVQTFSAFLQEAFSRIEHVAERPTVEYVTIAPLPPDVQEDQVAERFWQQLRRVERRERERGRTLIGPHRDELVFRIDDLEVRRYASQGQHRTFSMALKLAQYLYLRDRLDERPILLLDDVFGSLDRCRTEGTVELLQTDVIGQSLITATQRDPLATLVPFDQAEHRTLPLLKGSVQTPVETEM